MPHFLFDISIETLENPVEFTSVKAVVEKMTGSVSPARCAPAYTITLPELTLFLSGNVAPVIR